MVSGRGSTSSVVTRAGKSGPVAVLMAKVNHRVDAWRGERLDAIGRLDDPTDAVCSRNADRPEPTSDLGELIRHSLDHQAKQENVLVDENEIFILSALKASIRSVRSDRGPETR